MHAKVSGIHAKVAKIHAKVDEMHEKVQAILKPPNKIVGISIEYKKQQLQKEVCSPFLRHAQ